MKGLLLTSALTGVLLATPILAPSQTTSSTAKPAANAWMLTPTPYLAWNLGVPASVRAQRDRFFDETSVQRVPLTAPGSDPGTVASGETFVGTEPEISDVPNRVILTGKFTNHRSVLSASEFSLYTEITVHVDEVFEDRSGSGRPSAGEDIALLISGGAVTLRSGRSLSYNVAPVELFLEPDHRYLFVLSYHSDGEFYRYSEDWDLTDGTVRPNTSRTQYLARHGHSALSGVSVQQLGPALSRLLYRDR